MEFSDFRHHGFRRVSSLSALEAPQYPILTLLRPTLGTVIGAYIGYPGAHISWRWSEWIMLVLDAIVIFIVVAFNEETLAPRLLKYKAHYYRKLTGDDRFQSEQEAKNRPLGETLKTSFGRPFVLALEPIVLAFTLYLVVIYIVLFTFLDG